MCLRPVHHSLIRLLSGSVSDVTSLGHVASNPELSGATLTQDMHVITPKVAQLPPGQSLVFPFVT